MVMQMSITSPNRSQTRSRTPLAELLKESCLDLFCVLFFYVADNIVMIPILRYIYMIACISECISLTHGGHVATGCGSALFTYRSRDVMSGELAVSTLSV